MEEENSRDNLEKEEKEEETQEKETESIRKEPEEPKTEMRIDNNPDRTNVSQMGNKVKKNPWMMVSIVLGIVVIVLLFMMRGGITGNVI